jgi:hypothetical protein
MSLSMPTTSNPCAAKKRTDSAPINPADPVTSTTLKTQPPPTRYRSTGTVDDLYDKEQSNLRPPADAAQPHMRMAL